MNTSIYLKKRVYVAVVATLLAPTISFAEDSSDPNARMQQLEKMMQQMQQQRAEQDQQLQALSKELMAVQEQLAQAQESKIAEKGKSTGNPVYAAFKDGLVFEDNTGNWALQFNGRIQADYRSIDPDAWKNDTFSIRRARLGAQFSFLKDFLVRVEGEYSNTNDGSKGTAALTYGYVEYKHFPGARVRIGQFKPVFGLERGESTNFTDFMELSMATATGASFNSTYDRGIMLFGAPIKGAYYNLSYVNGSGQNNDNMKESMDVVGRVAGNVADWAGWKNAVVHVGLSGSGGSVQSSKTPLSTALSAYTESNGITSNATTYDDTVATKFFSTLAFTGNHVDKTRGGLETALAYGPVKLQSEYIRTNFDGRTLSHKDIDKDIDTWYTSLTWMLTGESYADSYKDGMFGRIMPKHNFAFDKDGFGAIELALRYSSFDASDFTTAAKGCVSGTGCLTSTLFTNEAHAWTAGAKWIMNPNARIVLNYVNTSFDTPIKINGKSSDSEEAVMMRAQYDF